MRSRRLIVLYGSEASGVAQATVPYRSVPAGQLLPMARALAVSPLWSALAPAVLLVRVDNAPTLAVLGEFDAAETARLAGIRYGLEEHLTWLRYVTYADAEAACERLAQRLVDRLGRSYLQDARFVALPRGGFFVLGMLSYALDLDHAQCAPSERDDCSPVVVVDDCAYTGHRVGRFLERLQRRQVVFAHLYSHPDLRAALEAREKIRAAVAAGDLHDYAPTYYGSAYPNWRELAKAAGPHPCYWSGQTERICFAWGEPDSSFWNPVTGKWESGWYLMDPDLCLKNRPGPDRNVIDLQVQPPARGAFRLPAGVLAAKFGGQLIVGRVDSGQCVALEPVAADMWTALLESDSLAGALKRLTETFDADAATIERDLAAFVDELLANELLERREGAGT